jgi:hypothetical protein
VIAPNTVVGNRNNVTRLLGGVWMKQVYLAADSIPRALGCRLAGVYYYQQNQREQQCIAAACEHPFIFKQLTLAPFDGDRRDDRATG